MAGEHDADSAPAVAEAPDLNREIGEAAVRLRILTPQQVEQALAARREKKLDDEHDPGLVFVTEGLLTRSQLDFVETVRRFKVERIADKKFGELAVERGWTTQMQVSAAMEVQKILFMREHKQVQIGEMLVRQHAITAEQRDILLTVQHRARQALAVHARHLAGEEVAAGLYKDAAAPVTAFAAAPAAPAADGAAAESGTITTEVEPVAIQGETAAETAPPPRERHVPKGFKVTLSTDHMAAFITLQSAGESPTDEALRAALRENSVISGIDDIALARLCEPGAPRDQAVQVAAGEPRESSRDAVVEYLFETHPLKAGRETSDETIDFKDRGDIPQVNEGDVLARKTPTIEGRAGRDVHGRTLKTSKPKDRRMAAGNGAQLGPDGLTVVAAVAGHPAVTPSGVVSVFPEYRIQGDLGYATGHVNFNGRVIVSGLVQPGFRVKCGELVANEVEGAEIEATGDVIIRGGVIGARIRTDGSVKAKYFHTSHIDALGDVIVHSELFESVVESSGVFHGDNCKLLGSRVSAKQGVMAGEIGSTSSPPCVITIGVDERVHHQIEQLETEIVEAEKGAEQTAEELAALEHHRDELDGRIGAMAQVQDRAQVQLRDLKAKADAGDTRAGAQLQILQEQISGAEQDLNALFAEQEELAKHIETLEQQQIDQRMLITNNRAEIAELRTWTEESPGKAELKVNKTTFQGTAIRAPHGEMRLTEDKKRLWIAEQETTDEGGQSSWHFVFQS